MFEYGKLAEELTVFTDSDWAGCKETRKSSAGVVMLGRHTVKTYTRKQKFITFLLHGTHDKSVQSIMKCYDDTHENLHDSVMSFNDTDALQGIGERMRKVRNAV